MSRLSVMERPDTGGERILVPRDLEEGERSGSKSVYGSDLCCRLYRKEAVMSASPAESSSIGMNSDDEAEEEGENEVQGPLRGDLKAYMDSLEEALPMRRGISSFYDGKSKSFASLADASAYQSMEGIVKPDTAYSRKRRNLLAHALLSENNHHRTTKTSHLIKTHGGRISKKPTSFGSSSSRATLALAVAMANTDTTINKITSASILDDHTAGLKSRELGPSLHSPHVGVHSRVGDFTPALALRSFCHWRSFSLADLQQCQATVRSPNHVSQLKHLFPFMNT